MAAGLRCGSTTIKYLLFFFNFIFCLCGLALLVLGVLGTLRSIDSDQIANLKNSFIVICVVGGAIFVISFCGCCGAVRESNCMLVTFAVLLLTIIICEVAIAIVLFVNIGGIQDAVQLVFKDAKENKNTASMETVNWIQTNFKCCGTKDASFWEGKIPDSCCDSGKCDTKTTYSDGCSKTFSDGLKVIGKALGAVAVAFAVIEVIGVWFALALAGEIKKLSR